MSMLRDWDQQFPGCEPVAPFVREALPNRWVRFHSLPESKRYPEVEAEYATLLHRHHRILEELAGPRREVVLLTTGYSDSPEPVRGYPELEALDPRAKPWRSVAMHDPEEALTFPNYWHVYSSSWQWRTGVLDSIVRLVADHVIANVMIVDIDCRWLLHPYDGGMDVIAASTDERDSLKARYADWLSARSDGL